MGGVFEQLSGAKALRVEGKSAQNIANFNAEVAEQEGKAAQARSGFDQMQQAKEAARIKGAMRAGMGSAGVLGTKGSLGIIGEQARESELENLLIGFEGETAMRQAGSRAEGLRLQGELDRQRGKSAGRRANVGFGIKAATFLAGL